MGRRSAQFGNHCLKLSTHFICLFLDVLPTRPFHSGVLIVFSLQHEKEKITTVTCYWDFKKKNVPRASRSASLSFFSSAFVIDGFCPRALVIILRAVNIVFGGRFMAGLKSNLQIFRSATLLACVIGLDLIMSSCMLSALLAKRGIRLRLYFNFFLYS